MSTASWCSLAGGAVGCKRGPVYIWPILWRPTSLEDRATVSGRLWQQGGDGPGGTPVACAEQQPRPRGETGEWAGQLLQQVSRMGWRCRNSRQRGQRRQGKIGTEFGVFHPNFCVTWCAKTELADKCICLGLPSRSSTGFAHSIDAIMTGRWRVTISTPEFPAVKP